MSEVCAGHVITKNFLSNFPLLYKLGTVCRGIVILEASLQCRFVGHAWLLSIVELATTADNILLYHFITQRVTVKIGCMSATVL